MITTGEVKGWPPRWITPVTQDQIERGDGELAIDFIQSMCRVTKDSIAANTGELLILRPWQQLLLKNLLARREDGRLLHKEGLILMPRKSGKSAILSALTLYLTYCGPDGGETYAVASSKDQARIVFNDAKKMIQMDPELSDSVKLYRDAIEVIDSGSVMRVLAAEAPQLEGLSPTAVCYDELHTAPNRELWDVLALAKASRVDSLQIAISTAGVRTDSTGRDSLCYSMYNYGKSVAAGLTEDPSFFMAAWEPKNPDANHLDPAIWEEANPGYGDISDPEDFLSSSRRTPAPEFKTKRLNLWVNTNNAWIDSKTWDECSTGEPIPDGAEVCIGFDGSYSGDASAIVAVSIPNPDDENAVPHVDKVAVWERPKDSLDDWRVPIADVEDAIRAACKKWNVKEIVCDPYRYARTFQVLESEGLPIVEFPQSPARMVPATQSFFEAVTQNLLTHSGDVDLTRHVQNAVLRVDARGSRLSKENRNSDRKIDLAVAAVMCHARASFYNNKPADPTPMFYDFDDI